MDVELRRVDLNDLPALFMQQLEPEANRLAVVAARSAQDFSAHLRKCLADEDIVMRTVLVDGEVAGHVVCFDRDGDRQVGYWLGREYWGRGVASAALGAFLAELGERPLYAHVAKHNAASRRVLEKCGFEFLRDTVVSDGLGAEAEGLVLVLAST